MKNIEKYNTEVRQAISNEYMEYLKTKAMKQKELAHIGEKLRIEAKTLPYRDYISLQKKADTLGEDIIKLDIQIDIWDKAREICLNIADKIL